TGAVIIPPAGAGYGVDVVTEGPTIDASTVLGMAIVDRPAVSALADMFVTVNDPGPRAAVLWGPGGSGRDTASLTVARTARMPGFAPTDARLLDTHRHLLHERSLFVIERRVERQLRAWLYAVLRCSRPHICLLVGAEEVRGVDGVALTGLGADALVA